MARFLQRGHDLGAVSGVSGVGVLGVGGVADPVHRLDAPLAAGDPGQAGGAGRLASRLVTACTISLLIRVPSRS